MIKSFFYSATSRDFTKLLSASVFSTIFNFLLIVILTRNMSTSEFGLIVTALTFTQLLSDFFELGLGSALLNSASGAGDVRALYIKASLMLRLAVSVVVAGLAVILAGPISRQFFHSMAIIPLIKISALGVLLGQIIAWSQTVYQTQMKFGKAALISSMSNPLRVLAILVLMVMGKFSMANIYWVLQLVLFLVMIFAFVGICQNLFSVRFEKEKAFKMLKFALPVGAAFALAALYTKLDQMMVLRLAGQDEAGIYGLASRLMMPFILVTSSLSLVLVPRFASLRGSEFAAYFKKSLGLIGGIGTVMLLAIPLSPWLLPLIFGKVYVGAVVPFQVLTLGVVLFLISSPISSAIIYHFKKPAFSLYLSAGSLILVWLLLNWLIPVYKGNGAAAAVVGVYLVQLLVSAFYFLKLSHR